MVEMFGNYDYVQRRPLSFAHQFGIIPKPPFGYEFGYPLASKTWLCGIYLIIRCLSQFTHFMTNLLGLETHRPLARFLLETGANALWHLPTTCGGQLFQSKAMINFLNY